ncbi:MAG TPA: S8 family serine peptidase [Blastocatellia bacterium]|nr:S8 family serine peptidase [Blastocatellia bacterium]
MYLATEKLTLIFIVTTLVLLPGSVWMPFSHAVATAQTADTPRAVDTLAIQSLRLSDSPVTAIIELQSDAVLSHELAVQAPYERGKRVKLSSAAAQTYEAAVMAEQRGFESTAASLSPELHVVTELRKLANAVEVIAPGYEIARLSTLPEVKRVQMSRKYHAMLNSSVPLINAPALWAKVGGEANAGRGIKIAIIDSGIDITNPLFSGSGFVAPPGFPRGDATLTNNKVIAAKAFLTNTAATAADQNGHGTSIAGIAAGDVNTPTPLGPISGVAPAAFLGNYRVLDSTGTGDEGLTANALEAAFTDGFDVACISLGAPASATPGVLDGAVALAAAGGMTVVAAAGDSGASGQMSITSPGTALNAITVGASSNSHIVGSSLSVTGPGQVPASLQGVPGMAGSTCSPQSRVFPIGPATLFDESLLDGQKLGCKARKLPLGSLTGKIALIERGNCSLTQKINNAAAAGALAVVIYNEDISLSPDGGDTLISPDTTGATIPSVFIRRTDGLAIKSWVDANPGAPITISGPLQFAQTPDVLAPFSSLGPTLAGTLKPDLTAPGEDIYSGAIKTCNDQGISDPSGFAAASGTSQAAAHVAGGAALIKQLHPAWTVAQIKSALANGTGVNVTAAQGSSAIAGVLAVGAGRIDLGAASSVALTLAPANISFGINKLKKVINGQPVTQTLNITSVSSVTATFNITVSPSPQSGFKIVPAVNSIVLAPGQTTQVQITVTPKQNPQKGDLTGFVMVGTGTAQPERAPFWARLK